MGLYADLGKQIDRDDYLTSKMGQNNWIYLTEVKLLYCIERKEYYSIKEASIVLGKKTTEVEEMIGTGHIVTYRSLGYLDDIEEDRYELFDKNSLLLDNKSIISEKNELAYAIYDEILDKATGGDPLSFLKIIKYKLAHLQDPTKIIILHGIGGSGKSTLVKLVRYLLGYEKNTVNLGEGDLKTNFSAINGMQLMIAYEETEVKNKGIANHFKRIIEGEMMTINLKYGAQYRIKNKAIIFITNNTDDGGFYVDNKASGARKLISFEATKRLEISKFDYPKVLTSNGEIRDLSGLKYWWEDKLKDIELVHNKEELLVYNESLTKMIESSNPMDAFYRLYFEEYFKNNPPSRTFEKGKFPKLGGDEYFIPSTRLLEDFKMWCYDNGYNYNKYLGPRFFSILGFTTGLDTRRYGTTTEGGVKRSYSNCVITKEIYETRINLHKIKIK